MEIYLGGMRHAAPALQHTPRGGRRERTCNFSSDEFNPSGSFNGHWPNVFTNSLRFFFSTFFTILNRHINVHLLMSLINAYMTKILFILSTTLMNFSSYKTACLRAGHFQWSYNMPEIISGQPFLLNTYNM